MREMTYHPLVCFKNWPKLLQLQACNKQTDYSFFQALFPSSSDTFLAKSFRVSFLAIHETLNHHQTSHSSWYHGVIFSKKKRVAPWGTKNFTTWTTPRIGDFNPMSSKVISPWISTFGRNQWKKNTRFKHTRGWGSKTTGCGPSAPKILLETCCQLMNVAMALSQEVNSATEPSAIHGRTVPKHRSGKPLAFDCIIAWYSRQQFFLGWLLKQTCFM